MSYIKEKKNLTSKNTLRINKILYCTTLEDFYVPLSLNKYCKTFKTLTKNVSFANKLKAFFATLSN